MRSEAAGTDGAGGTAVKDRAGGVSCTHGAGGAAGKDGEAATTTNFRIESKQMLRNEHRSKFSYVVDYG